MFGLGFTEILLILVIALIFLGPEKLPEVARTLGRTFGELKRAADEIRYDITTADYTPPRTPPNIIASNLKSDTPNRDGESPPSPEPASSGGSTGARGEAEGDSGDSDVWKNCESEQSPVTDATVPKTGGATDA